MKITNGTLINMINVLNKCGQKKLPQKISYAITKNTINLSGDYECYSKSIQKIISDYKDYIIKDENGKQKVSDIGLPIVDDAHMADYISEINELLKIEIDVNLYTIDDSVFDYDDSKYDALTAREMLQLQTILCENNKEG